MARAVDYIPEEAGRTALGIAKAMSREDIEGARHLWESADQPDLVVMALAVLLVNVIDSVAKKLGQPAEEFYTRLQEGIDHASR